MDVLILAGGKCSPDLKAASGATFRAHVPFGDQTFLEIVAAAAGFLGKPKIVAPAEANIPGAIPAGDRFVDSLANGLHHMESESFLLCTADLPFLTPAGVQGFLERCHPHALLNYPIIEQSLCDKDYPGMKRTTLRLREGEYTGGNLALIRTDLMRDALPHFREAYENRKKVFKLGRQVGLGTVFRLMLSRVAPQWVSIAALEADVSRFLGGPVRAVVCPFPEIGADIDSGDQYEIAKKLKNPV